jgi:long-subunit fatty acid transport protein
MRRALALLVVLAAGRAAAAPLVDQNLGGPVFVGPTSAHVTAAFWNPAAAGLLRGFHAYFSLATRADWLQIDRSSIDPATGEPSSAIAGVRNYPSTTAMPFAPSGFFGFTLTIGDKVTWGGAIFSPYSESAPDEKAPLRYQTLGSRLWTAYGNTYFSYHYKDFYFGVGASMVFAGLDTAFSHDENLETCAMAPCDVEDPAHTSDFHLATSTGLSPTFAWDAGVLYRIRPGLLIGAAYQSSPGFGKVRTRGTVDVTPAPATGLAPVSGDAEINFALPQSAILGVRWDVAPGRWQLLASLRYINFGAADTMDLRMAGPELRAAGVREWVLRYQGLRDVLVGEVGLERPAGGALRLGARLRVETGATTLSHVAPQQMDTPSASVHGGLETGLGGGFALTVNLSAGLALPGSVKNSAFSPSAQTHCVDSGYDLDQCEAARVGRAGPTAAGDYFKLTWGALVGFAYDRL